MPLPVHNHESFIGGTPAYQALNGPIRGLYRPIASLHANPAHSALRRVRHFRNAERILWLRGAAFGDDGRFFLEQWAAQSAQVEQLWSVR